VKRAKDALLSVFSTPRSRRRFYVRIFAFTGAFVSALQVLLWITGINSLSTGARLGFAGAFVIGLVAATVLSIPKRELHVRATKSFTAELTLTAGNIYEDPSEVTVVTTNRHFDVEEPWVSPASLIGQLALRLPNGTDDLRKAIDAELGLGPSLPVAPGATVTVHTPDAGDMLLLAVAARDEAHRSAVLVDEITQALSHLWTELRHRDAVSACMPVIGSGFARSRVNLVPLLLMQVTSYVMWSIEQPICPLTIVMPPNLLTDDIIRLVEDYCRELGLEEV
jgi:hypothetical protein